MRYLRSKRGPYAVPAVVVLAIAAGTVAPSVTGASSPPSLPSVTPAQLVSEVLSAKAPQLSGSLDWTANLGLPDLGALQGAVGGGAPNAFNPLTLLNGTYQVDVWLAGNQAEHISLSPAPGQEVDLVRNGDQAWFWDSSTMKVTHLTGLSGGQAAPSQPTTVPMTPQQLADRLLSHLGQSTSVVVPSTVYVGGQATYELLLTPKSAPGTTIDHIEVDVAADAPLQGVPLQVAVYAKGQAAPALELGFTRVQPGAPPAGELTFSVPPGATEVNHSVSLTRPATPAQSSTGTGSGPSTLGSGWEAVRTGTAPVLASPQYQTQLSAVTTVVQVGSQQGRLFTSELLNVLILPGGHYYAGFVTPQVLEAAATAAGA